MDFETDLRILRNLRIPYKKQLIRIIYSVIKDHEGKDFKDLNDLIAKVFPPRYDPAIKPVVTHSTPYSQTRRNRR